ncbi:MAG: toll/interleukin-1 receptor domain-containing protein, partial [Pyrinomonadaceae bacterium]
MTTYRPKVFISYTTNDEIAVRLRDALYERLDGGRADASYEVWVDKESLTPGDQWRHEIHNGLGQCDAAIVLLSEHALDTDAHPWVWNEAAILVHRRFMQEDFVLLPIVLPPVEVTGIQDRRWEPLLLKEIQMIAGQPVSEVVERVAARLEEVRLREEVSGPLHKLEKLIAADFKDVDDDIVKFAIAELGVRCGRWKSPKLLRRELAEQLLQAATEKLPDAMTELAQSASFNEKAGMSIVNRVMAFCLNPLEVAPLPEIAVKPRPDEARVVCLVARRQLTGELCVRRAWWGEERWYALKPDDRAGEDDAGALISSIWDSYRHKRGLPENTTTKKLREDAADYLKRLARQPLIILLPA